MDREKELLLKKIEQRRKEMMELGKTRSFVDERVVQISYQLDQLLNKYQVIAKGQTSSSS